MMAKGQVAWRDEQGSQSNNQNSLTHGEIWHWLIVHHVPIKPIDGKSARFFFDHVSGKHSRSRIEVWTESPKQPQLPQSIPRFEQCRAPEASKWRGGHIANIYTMNSPSGPPQKNVWLCTRVTRPRRRRKNQTFPGLLDTGSELLLILGDQK